MRVPLPNVAQTMLLCEVATSISKIVYILVKRCACSATFLPRPQHKLNHSGMIIFPCSKQISSRFSIWPFFYPFLDLMLLSFVYVHSKPLLMARSGHASTTRNRRSTPPCFALLYLRSQIDCHVDVRFPRTCFSIYFPEFECGNSAVLLSFTEY